MFLTNITQNSVLNLFKYIIYFGIYILIIYLIIYFIIGLLHLFSIHNTALDFFGNIVNFHLFDYKLNLSSFNIISDNINSFLSTNYPQVLEFFVKKSITTDLYWSIVSDTKNIFDSFLPSMKIWYTDSFNYFA